MIRKTLILALAISMSLAFEPGHEKESYIFSKFQEFLKRENKKYTTVEEYMARFKIFKANYEKLEAMIINPDSKPLSYEVGVNKFFDMTPQEFRRTYLNLDINVVHTIKAQSKVFTLKENKAPEELDWRDHGAVGEVKDQGACGSCWAFSTVGNLEGQYYLKNKKYVQFSEQQLVDCDNVDQGCHGGLMENAYNYYKTAGVMTQKDYTYNARKGSCKFDEKKAVANFSVTGYSSAPSQDEDEIKEYLYSTGPLAIALNADPLQFYSGGIIDEDSYSCDPQGLNHGVVLVGYGSENGQDYWIVKNSWGSGWGENGYFRMARGKGTCGINTYVVSAETQ